MTSFFNKYAGYRADSALSAPGAWALLHVGLDSSDTARFPEATYGTASLHNAERMVNIAKAFSRGGAGQGDPQAATKHAQYSRRREELKDVGWQIFKGNYHQSLRQLFVSDTQDLHQGRWRMGPAQQRWGRFARAATRYDALRFVVENGVFTQGDALHIRVVYLDGIGESWGVQVAAGRAEHDCTMREVKLGNTGNWLEYRFDIPIRTWVGGGACDGADVQLSVTERSEQVFAFIELSRTPFGDSHDFALLQSGSPEKPLKEVIV